MAIYPDNTFVSNVYNAAGYPVRVRDRAGRWTDNTYDAAGHLVRVDYPNNDWVKKEYTGNLVSKLMGAAGNTTEYFYCHAQRQSTQNVDWALCSSVACAVPRKFVVARRM